MSEIKVLALVLLTFIVGFLAGYDFGYDWRLGSENKMNKKHYEVYLKPDTDLLNIDYGYSTQEPSNVFLPKQSKDNDQVNNPVACTMEAKICPDGSSVGRSGPNCEFAPCPGN